MASRTWHRCDKAASACKVCMGMWVIPNTTTRLAMGVTGATPESNAACSRRCSCDRVLARSGSLSCASSSRHSELCQICSGGKT